MKPALFRVANVAINGVLQRPQERRFIVGD
jgi:hypothetical protein